jgi:putative flavoprotein involved in K+ transport
MNPMLGDQQRYAYAPGREIVERMEQVAAGCPVREGVRVERLAPAGDGWALATGDGELRARTVVVATGDQNVPRIPALAARLPGRVAQLHAATYRSPAQLPEGAVLIVGTAQSGCQIAEDLLLSGGRRVVLATSAAGRVPFRYRGRDILEWLIEAGFMDQRPQDLPDPAMMKAAMPIIAPGHGLSLPGLARAGAALAGRPVAVDGERLGFDDSAAANVAAGDAFAARARATADAFIQRRGLDAPPAEPDEHDLPVELDPPAALDLRAAELGSVIWCTGFTGDFSWLDPTLVGADGLPRHTEGTAPAPGLWYLGLRWMRRRGSSILYGFPGDAAWVAGEVGTHLGG